MSASYSAAVTPLTPPERLRVLVVEDDELIAGRLARGLTADGYRVEVAGTGRAALAAWPGAGLVLLDLGLPDLDGFQVAQNLRARSEVPIIVVTARGDERDRVRALDLGADDYLVKPFGLAELKARIRAVLRRVGPDATGVYRHRGLVLDAKARRVTLAGAKVALTGREFDILAVLIDEPDRVVSREEIFSRVWDEHWGTPSKVLDVHVASLRRKLGDPALVETVYGRGFRMGAGG